MGHTARCLLGVPAFFHSLRLTHHEIEFNVRKYPGSRHFWLSPLSSPSTISGAWSLPPPLLQPWLTGVGPHCREPVPGRRRPGPSASTCGAPPPARGPRSHGPHAHTTYPRPPAFSASSSLPSSLLCPPGRASARPGAYPRRSLLTPNVPSGPCPRKHSPAAR